MKRRREAPTSAPPHPQHVFEFVATMATAMFYLALTGAARGVRELACGFVREHGPPWQTRFT
jgi:hypothetical protein